MISMVYVFFEVFIFYVKFILIEKGIFIFLIKIMFDKSIGIGDVVVLGVCYFCFEV